MRDMQHRAYIGESAVLSSVRRRIVSCVYIRKLPKCPSYRSPGFDRVAKGEDSSVYGLANNRRSSCVPRSGQRVTEDTLGWQGASKQHDSTCPCARGRVLFVTSKTRKAATLGLASTPTYASITALSTIGPALQTHLLFSQEPAQVGLSPIDEFIENTNALNTLAARAASVTRELSSLLLLGYMSAMESYFRALIRELINVDEVAKRCAEPQLVTYGAAVSHKVELLAEALLEGVSFASRTAVTDALKAFLGLKNLANEMGSLLDEYQKICELRHCCVHRFGKLGAKNAIALGLANHRECLERPLSLDNSSFQEMAVRLRTFAKSVNNVVCMRVLERTAENRDDHGAPLYSVSWTWNARQDHKRFTGYYRIFASAKDSIPSPSVTDVYESFRRTHK